MMKRFFSILTIVLLFASTAIKAQDSTNVYYFDFHKLKPIVQVFGTAAFDIDNNNYGYSFGRAHLGFQYQFNNKWSAKMIIDRGRPTSVGEITLTDPSGNSLNVQNTSKEGSYYTFWLKFASLQWKVTDKLTLEGGAILQNHYITQERFWGLRYVAQTFQDLYWKIPSSDLGFIAYYKINNIISFDASITNGEGTRVKQDAFGKVKFAGGLNINPSKKIQTRIFYHNRQSGIDSTSTEQMISVFAGFKPLAKFRIGSEFNYMANLDNINKVNSYGFSFYSAYQLSNKTELFARYDKLYYEYSENMATGNRKDGNTIMGGISHSPVKGVNISVNYQKWLSDETSTQNESRILLSMEYKF
ncbi:MAG: hypothetical protein IMY72_01905 [Bacteroidetes bacterium]|nr:hypothetical protein [Bacteroidota bacterium]